MFKLVLLPSGVEKIVDWSGFERWALITVRDESVMNPVVAYPDFCL